MQDKMSPFWTTKNIIAPQCSPQKKLYDAFKLLGSNLRKLKLLDRKMDIQRLFQVRACVRERARGPNAPTGRL